MAVRIFPIRLRPILSGAIFIRLALFITAAGFAAEVNVGTGFFGGVSISKPVKTFKDFRDEGVIFQQLDYSCGSAALATVLKYQFGFSVSEQEIIEFILRTGDLRKIKERKGFSLLDLQRFVESRGYKAVGYRLDLESLVGFDGLVIAPISVHRYNHAVVVTRITGGRVFLVDPARGRLSVPVRQFERFWYAGNELGGTGGIGFVVSSPAGVTAQSGKLPLEQSGYQYVDEQQVRALMKERILFVPPVPGEF